MKQSLRTQQPHISGAKNSNIYIWFLYATNHITSDFYKIPISEFIFILYSIMYAENVRKPTLVYPNYFLTK